ncbi:MAG: molybdopterin molybdotransferase MoeA [Gemmatales bacterium]|nr:molybdopterin molybdotransferase MoeA [Gemmatales bacterium]MDW8222468.1 molybdopterin molybdotransferase MoeA [Gemmatales bacterium]
MALDDVRMRGFRRRWDAHQARQQLLERITALGAEEVSLWEAVGRILAEDVASPMDVPYFDRAAMDGYAVRGEETFGASSYSPVSFRLVGESLPGRPCPRALAPGETVRIMTGAPLPEGADTVVRAELALEQGTVVQVLEAVPPGKSVSRRGEDVQAGNLLLSRGRRLRPQDVAILAAAGLSRIPVIRQPRVAVLITGDELMPLGAHLSNFRIIDSNSVMLDALIRRDGGLPMHGDLVPDQRETLRQRLKEACEAAEVVLISGGSSVGREDYAPLLVAELGELLVHGVAMRPSSPTGLGWIAGRPVILLPGNPVSCLCAYDFFARPAICRLAGRSTAWPYRQVCLPLAAKISSELGRLDYVRVRIRNHQVEPIATSGASILSTTTQADGFVLVPPESEGYAAGQTVPVYLYDEEESHILEQ